jgi:hypothetical protein
MANNSLVDLFVAGVRTVITVAHSRVKETTPDQVIPVSRQSQSENVKEKKDKKYEFVNLSGNPTWTFLNWTLNSDALQNQVKTYFLQEMFKRGILVLSTNNVTTTLSRKDISKILTAYAEVFEAISQALERDSLDALLECQPIVPLFKVR